MEGNDKVAAEAAGELVSMHLPGAGVLVPRVWNLVTQEWSRNNSIALKAAVRASRLTREDLVERMETRPELVSIATRVAYEAAMTGAHEVLEALGAVYGAAARGDMVEVDAAAVILKEISSLRPEDLPILRALRRMDRLVLETDESRDSAPSEKSARAVAAPLGTTEEAVGFGVRRLAAHGFAYSHPGPILGGDWYSISHLGEHLCQALDLLDAAGE